MGDIDLILFAFEYSAKLYCLKIFSASDHVWWRHCHIQFLLNSKFSNSKNLSRDRSIEPKSLQSSFLALFSGFRTDVSLNSYWQITETKSKNRVIMQRHLRKQKADKNPEYLVIILLVWPIKTYLGYYLGIFKNFCGTFLSKSIKRAFSVKQNFKLLPNTSISMISAPKSTGFIRFCYYSSCRWIIKMVRFEN